MLDFIPLLKKVSLFFYFFFFQKDQLLCCNIVEEIENKKTIINEPIKHGRKEFYSLLETIQIGEK